MKRFCNLEYKYLSVETGFSTSIIKKTELYKYLNKN